LPALLAHDDNGAMSSARLYATELRTRDWPRLVDWYRDVVGLKVAVRMTGERYALLVAADLRRGDGRLMILGRDDAESAARRWSLAFEVSDLNGVTEQLAATGLVVPAATEQAEGYRELVVDDPDGNRVRFFCWPERS
jgi:predicted enzyme related to lactoylglutathione lyase